jgi:hypothetical protein
MHDGHDDFAFDHAPGLPEPLPRGEEILWQGRPNAWRLAVESLAIRWVVGYFAVLALWRILASLGEHSVGAALASAVPLAVLCAAAVGILWGFSWVQARATIYTITTARVIMRIGAALQLTLQLPFSRLENAALDLHGNGTGTIALEPTSDGGAQLSYMVLWPHVRPWRMKLPNPALRAIPDAERVARILAEAAEEEMARPRVTVSADARTPTAAARPVPAE